jgi:hypothetical protein
MLVRIDHFQQHVVRAGELGWIKPDCKMHSQRIFDEFGSGTPGKKTSAVP